MADCGHTPGNAAMYGLGIRLGFYLQWFGLVAAPWLAASGAHGLQLINTLFVLASSLALVIQASKGELSPAEIHAVLLLASGSFYFAVPLYLWRLATCCSPNHDPSRWPRAPLSASLRASRFLVFVSLLGFQMWFWASGVKGLKRECRQYGFFFAKVPIQSGGFVALNVLFSLALLLGSLWVLCVEAGLTRGHRPRRKKRVRRAHVEALQLLQSTFELAVASLMAMAVELVIQWNKLGGVSDMSTAAQLMPTVVSAGFLACVVSIWVAQPEGSGGPPSSDKSTNSHSASGSRPRSGDGSGPGAGLPFQPGAGFVPAREYGGLSRSGGPSSRAPSERPTSTTSSSLPGEPQHPFPPTPPAPVPPASGLPPGGGGVPPPFPPARPVPVFMSGGMPPVGGLPPPLHTTGGLPPPPPFLGYP